MAIFFWAGSSDEVEVGGTRGQVELTAAAAVAVAMVEIAAFALREVEREGERGVWGPRNNGGV